MRKTQYLRRTIGALVLFAAGISPFAVYIALKATETTPPPAWPSDVAIVTAEAGALRSLALVHFRSPTEAMIVRFPIETSLNVPAAGALRALTAYGIGGAPMLARGFGETVGVTTPFWAEWTAGAAAGREPDRTNLGPNAADVVALIANPATPVVTAPGRTETQSGVQYYLLDRAGLSLVLRGLAPPTPTAVASPTPTPTPSGTPSGVSVEVLNQGGTTGAAAEIANRLQSAGYLDVRTGNSSRRAIEGVIVYYTAGAQSAGEAVARVIGSSVADVAPLPSTLQTNADVLVLVGREPSRPPTTTTTSSPTPSESEVVVP
ncbi:MAG TPA: LytR C-terminal domain-containing protein [Actinomycetota bacterium]